MLDNRYLSDLLLVSDIGDFIVVVGKENGNNRKPAKYPLPISIVAMDPLSMLGVFLSVLLFPASPNISY